MTMKIPVLIQIKPAGTRSLQKNSILLQCKPCDTLISFKNRVQQTIDNVRLRIDRYLLKNRTL